MLGWSDVLKKRYEEVGAAPDPSPTLWQLSGMAELVPCPDLQAQGRKSKKAGHSVFGPCVHP